MGNAVTLTENVDYTCSTDGYFRLDCSYEAGSITEGYVNDVRLVIMATPNGVAMREYQNTSLFVKAGMRIKFVGGWASFYPII